MACWFGVQISALAGSLVVLRKLWDPERTGLGLSVTLALFFGWHATQLTLLYAQTNFLFLLAILGFARGASAIGRGAALGAAIVVKPIAAVLLIDVVLRRQWITLVSVFVPPAAAFALFLGLQGWPGLMRFVNREPSDIAFAYYESFFNQSALGVLLRWFECPALAKPIFFPPYLVLAGALTITTTVVVARVREELSELRISYVLLLALLVYPGTQMYYSVWLLAVLAFMWQDREALAGGPWIVPITIALAAGLGWSRWNFAAHFLVWLILTVLFSVRRPLRPTRETSAISPTLRPRLPETAAALI
jgi:hypothetical protein